MDGSSQRIPNFLLYGDQADGREPPFVHIETVAARSRALNWTIGAHRHDNLGHILLIRAGGGRFELDGVPYDFGPGGVIGVPSKLVHGFDFRPGTDGLVLTLSDSLSALARDSLADSELDAGLSRSLLADLSGDSKGFAAILHAMERIEEELSHPRIGQLSAIRSHVALILLTIMRAERFHGTGAPCSSRDLALVDRLRRMIGRGLKGRMRVGDYALALAVTPARLNAACRKVAGCSALHLLHAALLAEGKRALLYTSVPVGEIAYSLGFDDPAYFSRFFSRRTGCAPSAFRALPPPRL
jgi:AraC family transcriptional activator of pobA